MSGFFFNIFFLNSMFCSSTANYVLGWDQKAKEDAGRNKSMQINSRLAEQGNTQPFDLKCDLVIFDEINQLSVWQDKNSCYCCETGFLKFKFIPAAAACCLSSPHFLFLSVPLAEFSRESLLEAGGGLKCPLSVDKVGCSNSTNVADPSSRQGATHAGTVHESD